MPESQLFLDIINEFPLYDGSGTQMMYRFPFEQKHIIDGMGMTGACGAMSSKRRKREPASIFATLPP